MTVLLRRSDDLPASGWADRVEIGPGRPQSRATIPDLARRLEIAFDAIAPDLLILARRLGAAPDAALAHAPACASNVSDLGAMLAWDRLVRGWAAEDATILVICDDPWLFRHWSGLPGVTAGKAPPLWIREVRLALRGRLARLAVSLRMARAALALSYQRGLVRTKAPALLVYGHPRSTPDGGDAYFGPLMAECPALTRLLHVDCPPVRARALQGDGRTLSLHAFGSPLAALALWTKRWRPVPSEGWLVRRAAALEGATGTPAMIAWQLHCQRRWLAAQQPAAVAWPWENHSWERAFVRMARASGIVTIGYQHAVVGRREWNYAPTSNPDGEASLPDRIWAVGQADRERLVGLGCPEGRLTVAGALRYPQGRNPGYDPAGPILLALPFDGAIGTEMIEAVRPLGAAGRRILVKDHPMTPLSFQPSDGIERTEIPFSEQENLSAVVYCITTLGLEAVLAGLPTIRFLPSGRPVVDVMPEGAGIPSATAADLAGILCNPVHRVSLEREWVFARPNMAWWQTEMSP